MIDLPVTHQAVEKRITKTSHLKLTTVTVHVHGTSKSPQVTLRIPAPRQPIGDTTSNSPIRVRRRSIRRGRRMNPTRSTCHLSIRSNIRYHRASNQRPTLPSIKTPIPKPTTYYTSSHKMTRTRRNQAASAKCTAATMTGGRKGGYPRQNRRPRCLYKAGYSVT